MGKEIILSLDAHLFLDDLSTKLFTLGYFSFPDTARQSVQKLHAYIQLYLGVISGKPAPAHFDRYGKNMEYITYRANHATTWYIFYQQHENRSLICHITNNHVAGQHMADSAL